MFLSAVCSFWSDSSPAVPFEDPDIRIHSGVNDPSLVFCNYLQLLHLTPELAGVCVYILAMRQIRSFRGIGSTDPQIRFGSGT
ncbi:hypothetical protein AVEN_72284-1 [Araneus ventricosus]|uniref:Uncharacterized protein n=1 Tax=Araneus ventricosus TaxID=182803 RepID=A0A4Y2VMF9_ARAVE|nr:hypothetical protein AVEN_84688-1 [Araneus ventricosus]GBO26359.1 hypothetical protein AVEN_32028-1 [Araneus ventricosus]GBO26365.1 hypothetical protein AVEN_72284-1 [Araneus ventricosus]